MRQILITLSAVLLFSAFNRDARRDLRFVCWRLREISSHKDPIARPVKSSRPFLVIKDSVFYGNSGCNDFTGKCTLTDDSIFFSWPGATKIHCPGIAWIENSLFHDLMHGKAKYLISGDTLQLHGRKGDMYKFFGKSDMIECNCKFSKE
jgi:heat shock protein HslJ